MVGGRCWRQQLHGPAPGRASRMAAALCCGWVLQVVVAAAVVVVCDGGGEGAQTYSGFFTASV